MLLCESLPVSRRPGPPSRYLKLPTIIMRTLRIQSVIREHKSVIWNWWEIDKVKVRFGEKIFRWPYCLSWTLHCCSLSRCRFKRKTPSLVFFVWPRDESGSGRRLSSGFPGVSLVVWWDCFNEASLSAITGRGDWKKENHFDIYVLFELTETKNNWKPSPLHLHNIRIMFAIFPWCFVVLRVLLFALFKRYLDEPLLRRPFFNFFMALSPELERSIEVNLYFLNIPSLYYLLRASWREIMRMRDIRTQSMNALNRTKLHKGEPLKIGFISRGKFHVLMQNYPILFRNIIYEG